MEYDSVLGAFKDTAVEKSPSWWSESVKGSEWITESSWCIKNYKR